MLDKNFVIYAHFTLDTNELFYIGEGRPNRARSKHNRSRYWNFKVAKHGFYSEVLINNLSKNESEDGETKLIIMIKAHGTNLVNICNGPMHRSHWLTCVPKEMHPMFGRRGRKCPEVAEANRKRRGEAHKMSEKTRAELIERNKNGKFNRAKTAVKCIETGEVFESVKAALAKCNKKRGHIDRAIKTGMRACGFHWQYI